MRASLPALLLVAVLSAGCIQAGTEIIQQAREDSDGGAPQESIEGREGEPTESTPVGTEPRTRAAPSSPTTTSPATPTSATPPPVATPTPRATPPTPTPPSTPTPVSPTPVSPTPSAGPWPTEASYVRYEVEAWDVSGRTRVFADWQHDDGDWVGRCEGTHVAPGGTTTSLRRVYDEDDPPHWPLLNTRAPPAPGEPVRAWYLSGCEITSRHATYDGDHAASGPAFSTRWDARTGLVLSWEMGDASAGGVGRLVASDAFVT